MSEAADEILIPEGEAGRELTEETKTTTTRSVSDGPVGSGFESQIASVSVRAWICLLVIGTVCVMGLKMMKVEEPLYTLSIVIIGFYFGQNSKPKSQL